MKLETRSGLTSKIMISKVKFFHSYDSIIILVINKIEKSDKRYIVLDEAMKKVFSDVGKRVHVQKLKKEVNKHLIMN